MKSGVWQDIENLLEWAEERRAKENEDARKHGGHLQSMAIAAGEVHDEYIEALASMLAKEKK